MVYGYRWGEVVLPDLPKAKEGSSVVVSKVSDPAVRAPVLTSLGMHVSGICMWHPDPKDTASLVAGAFKRVVVRPPAAERGLLSRVREFTTRYVRAHYTPLSPDADTTVQTWLEHTQYPEWRKKELLLAWENFEVACGGRLRRRHTTVKGFGKWEKYLEPKFQRLINPRPDVFKCKVGPLFKLIESVVYEDPHFIKHIPVADRPEYIMSKLSQSGCTYVSTDYTSFESLFTREVMEAVEFVLYEHMVSRLPCGREFMSIVSSVIGGTNTCVFDGGVRVTVPATRMSGDMCTSLGNGFSNLIFMLFACQEVGCQLLDGVVEGDDGLFAISGCPPDSKTFERMGLTIKLQTHDRLSTASFCGLVFDEEDRINLVDPRKVLASFGWASGRYAPVRDTLRRRLLRCKALSIAYQYPGCPVVQSLALAGLRATRNVRIGKLIERRRDLSQWDRELLRSALRDEQEIMGRIQTPPVRTRLLMEELYGIRMEDQRRLEHYFDGIDVVCELNHPVLMQIMPESWGVYYSTYSAMYPGPVPQIQVRPERHEWPKVFPVTFTKAARQWALRQGVQCLDRTQ